MTSLKRLLALLLCLAMVLSFAACSDNGGSNDDDDKKEKEEEKGESLNRGDEDCDHVWGEWEILKENSCTKDGSQMRTCELCEREEKETIVAPGHAFYGDKCEECGKKAPECAHKKTKEVKISEATCEKDGRTNIVCTKCNGIVNVNYEYSYGHTYVYHEGKDPTCKEPGWYSYSTCEKCDYTSLEEIPATGHAFVAGVCTSCGEADGNFEVVNGITITNNEYTVPKTDPVSYDVVAAVIDVHTGNMAAEEQKDTYTFTAAETGRYYIWLTEVLSGTDIGVYVHNSLGEIASNHYCGNEEGVTVDCVAGETYTIYLCESWGFSSYQLNVGHKKATVDISGYDVINDSIEYLEQYNTYTFTPAVAGSYNFSFSEMMNNCELRIHVFNRLNEEIAWENYCSNGEGVTVDNMVAGETYTIAVEHDYYDMSSYTMTVGKQSAVVDASAYTAIHDSIRYPDQKNVYNFVVPANGAYRFELANITDNKEVDLYVYNHLGERVNYSTYVGNGEGLTLTDLVAGDTYTIVVEYSYELADYTLKIGTPKAALDISSDMAVKDRIEYGDQVITYNFVADKDGDHSIVILMDSDARVELYIYDKNGNTIDYDSYFYNGDALYLNDVKVGDAYTICVYEDGYLVDYTLSVQ